MADAYYDNVTVLVNFEDDTGLGAGVPIALDRSKTPAHIGWSASPPALTNAAKRSGNYGFEANANSFLDVVIASSDTRIAFGTGDFTIEVSVFFRASFAHTIMPALGKEQGWDTFSDWIIFRDTDSNGGKLKFTINNQSLTIASDASISTGTYHDVAVQRKAGVISMYIDGQPQAATNSSGVAITSTANNVRIGYASIGYYLRGYVDNVRITSGVARYSGAYTPSAPEYPANYLTCTAVSSPTSTTLYTLPAINCTIHQLISYSWNWYHGGHGRLPGTVKEKSMPSDAPVVRPIYLYSKDTMALVAGTWSNTNGEYAFEMVSPTQKFFVVGFDYTKNYNAVIADDLTPTPHQY